MNAMQWSLVVAAAWAGSQCQSLEEGTQSSRIQPVALYAPDAKEPIARVPDPESVPQAPDIQRYSFAPGELASGKSSKTSVKIKKLPNLAPEAPEKEKVQKMESSSKPE